MPEDCILDESHVYGPTAIAVLKEALSVACVEWDLPEQFNENHRGQLAVIIMNSAYVGFAEARTLAKMALDQLKISAAAQADHDTSVLIDRPWNFLS